MSHQGFTEWEILEEHTDIILASTRELQLQAEFGLPIDTVPYFISVQNRFTGTSESVTKGNITKVLNGLDMNDKMQKMRLNSDHVAAGKLGGIIGSKIISDRINTCPHCSKQIKGRVYHRWHGDNCKHKKTLTN
jgi:hypothetical protein